MCGGPSCCLCLWQDTSPHIGMSATASFLHCFLSAPTHLPICLSVRSPVFLYQAWSSHFILDLSITSHSGHEGEDKVLACLCCIENWLYDMLAYELRDFLEVSEILPVRQFQGKLFETKTGTVCRKGED